MGLNVKFSNFNNFVCENVCSFKINVYLYTIKLKQQVMKTIKTNQKIDCKNIEDARAKADKISNGIIIVKDNFYSIVNYKTFTELKSTGYIQVR